MPNEFKESLVIHNHNLKQYDTFKEKLQSEVFQVLLNVEPVTPEDIEVKLHLYRNIKMYLQNYEELDPILARYFQFKEENKNMKGER